MRDEGQRVTTETVDNLLSKLNSDKFTEQVSKDIVFTIEILQGDLNSISRQIQQRENNRDLSAQLGEDFDEAAHEDWLQKIRKAVSRKRDQIRTLERELGNARTKSLDKRYLFVDKFHEISKCADQFVADIEDSRSGLSSEASSTLDDLIKQLDTMDALWEDWCD